MFAVVRRPRVGIDALDGGDLVVVGARRSPIPGNAGTLIRSAAAAGARRNRPRAGSVDAYNPKVVRASAGACFAVQIVEGVPAVECWRRSATPACAGSARSPPAAARPRRSTSACRPRSCSATKRTGSTPTLPLDELVTIPMHAAESLNVAMAGTVLLFEAARQRRAA